MTSATLDGEKFSTYFDECPVLHIPGRCFPVSVAYAVEVPVSYQEEVVNLALDIHCDHPPGDVLIFMTGQVRRDGPLHVARSLAVCVCRGLGGSLRSSAAAWKTGSGGGASGRKARPPRRVSALHRESTVGFECCV